MGRKGKLVLNEYEIYERLKTKNIIQIAKDLNVNKYSLYTWCKRHNVKVTRITNEEILMELLENKKTPKEIAFEYHLGYTTILRKIERLKDKGIINKRKYERW